MIRLAIEDDLESLVGLWHELMLGQKAYSDRVMISQENIQRWREYCWSQIKQGLVKVSTLDGSIIGYALMAYRNTPMEEPYRYAVIMDLYVKPPFRGKGIGRALLEDAKKQLKALGFEYVHLWVFPDNRDAVRFYEREGFECVMWEMRRKL